MESDTYIFLVHNIRLQQIVLKYLILKHKDGHFYLIWSRVVKIYRAVISAVALKKYPYGVSLQLLFKDLNYRQEGTRPALKSGSKYL
jgi:hypothetical protein